MRTLSIILGLGMLINAPRASENWKREVVFGTICRYMIQFPPGQDSGTLDEVTIISDSLRAFLLKYNVELLRKGFPNFNLADTIGIVPETGDTVELADFSKVFVARFPVGSDIPKIAKEMTLLGSITHAEPNCGVELDGVWPNDSLFRARRGSQSRWPGSRCQWPLYNDGPDSVGFKPGADIKAADSLNQAAWDIFRGSDWVRVGILDDGVWLDHPDLKGRVSGDNNPEGGHGTMVAGIIGAKTDNDTGVAGIDWHAQLISRAITLTDPAHCASAINTAVLDDGCDILNMSWHNPTYSITVRRALANAYKLNRVSVVAMGDRPFNYPVAFVQGIIAVGGSTPWDTTMERSWRGPYIDVAAPGCRLFIQLVQPICIVNLTLEELQLLRLMLQVWQAFLRDTDMVPSLMTI